MISAATYLFNSLNMNPDMEAMKAADFDKRAKVEQTLGPLKLSPDTYEKIRDQIIQEFVKGLGKETNASAAIKMYPSYVRAVPDGTEQGDFLALDLGGTNFRVLRITLEGNKVSMQNKIYMIAKKLMIGPGSDLFDYIASCLADFVKEQNLAGKALPLGFTFSFPCKQEGLTHARLTSWTKGFSCPGVVGEDVVKLLHKSLAKHPIASGIMEQPIALLNDTVGTLMSCSFLDQNTTVGIIIGTGSNACYMEKLENVELWDEDYEEPKQVIINTEWGAFGSDGALDFIRTRYDYDIDKNSLNPGKQIYEKMISGMYMGEIVRLALVDLCEKGLLFNGNGSEELYARGQFFTKYVSEIESDTTDDFPNTRQVLDEIGIEYVTQEDCAIVQYACAIISARAAYLASAGVAAILTKMGRPKVTVAVDGSLYRYHPKFHSLMMDKIGKLTSDVDYKLILSEDGSGKGAALVAAVACRLAREKAERHAATGGPATRSPHSTPGSPKYNPVPILFPDVPNTAKFPSQAPSSKLNVNQPRQHNATSTDPDPPSKTADASQQQSTSQHNHHDASSHHTHRNNGPSADHNDPSLLSNLAEKNSSYDHL